MKTLFSDDIHQLEKRARVQLINSLPGAKPIGLIGTQDTDGKTNLAPFSSITHLGSIPPLIGIVSRPAPEDRHTVNNIQTTRSYTINHVHRDFGKQAHQCSARFDRDTSEFTATGLTPHFEEGVVAPFVAESHFRFALHPVKTIPIELNGTILVIGEVTCIQVEEDALAEDGSVDLIKTGSMASTALDTYFDLSAPIRLPYAKKPNP